MYTCRQDGIQGGTGMIIGNGSGTWIPRELKKLGFSFDLFSSLLMSGYDLVGGRYKGV
jgi:hypothetical protein